MPKESGTPKLDDLSAPAVSVEVVQAQYTRDYRFWMVFVATLTVDMLSALDLTAIPTALPTIVSRLHGTNFVWAGGAYPIASTAIVPLIGGLVSVFGRKPVLMTFILFFALGSAISGSAQNMLMLIAGRAIQGFGGGGCIATTEIIYADLIPLPELGKFQGITASVWALASAIGPPIGGALASSGAWRWIFFLNLPVCGIALTLVYFFLHVRAPRSTFREKILHMDWTGNAVVIGSTVSVLFALTFGGLHFPWSSFHVLLPLVLGAIGLVAFFFIEFFWIKEPMVPRFFFTNKTTLSGYLGTLFHGIVSLAAIYFLPVYFQACKGASAVGSGVDMFGLSFVIPAFAIFTGLSVEVVGRYRPQNYIGWVCIIAGFIAISLLDENSSRARYIGSEIPLAVGLGIVWISTTFPILAPLPYSNNAYALAFFTFVRCFAQSWGIIIGGALLQNKLQQELPTSLLKNVPQGAQIAYAIIPRISHLSQGLQTAVRTSFADSVRLIWHVMIGLSGGGLLTCLLMGEVSLRTDMDGTWGLTDVSPSAEAAENRVSA